MYHFNRYTLCATNFVNNYSIPNTNMIGCRIYCREVCAIKRCSLVLLFVAVAGGIAAAITTPFDVVKTVLNTQQTPEISGNSQFGRMVFLKANAYRGLSDAVYSIYASRGVQGFMRGMHYTLDN